MQYVRLICCEKKTEKHSIAFYVFVSECAFKCNALGACTWNVAKYKVAMVIYIHSHKKILNKIPAFLRNLFEALEIVNFYKIKSDGVGEHLWSQRFTGTDIEMKGYIIAERVK